MPTFVYSGRSRSGEKVDGTVEAVDRRGAIRQIERMGHIPASVAEQAAAAPPVRQKKGSKRAPAQGRPSGRTRMSTREVLVFTTELSDLLASGMTLGNALNCLANRETGGPVDTITADLRDEIIRGSSLSEALSRHPRSFSRLYGSMIRAGEASGAVAEVLRRLVTHYERVQQVKEQVTMALVYPCIVIVLGVATLIFAMIYVIPKFKIIFESLGQTLPLPTRMLIGSSTWLAKYGWLAALVIAFLGVMANRAVQTKRGRLVWHTILLRLPLIRGIVASSIFANLSRTLGTLLANGVPVLQALGIVEQTVGNVVISNEIHNARDRVTDGTTISGPLAAGKVFPRIMTDMLAVGEQTGDVSGSLSHIARRYENDLDRNVKIFTTALEPILIVIVAVMVGFVAISILLAVFNLTNGLDV